jgi:hypothetical protein
MSHGFGSTKHPDSCIARNLAATAFRIDDISQRYAAHVSARSFTSTYFSASGAASKKAWGIAPGIETATKTSAEGAFQTDEPVEVMCEK